MSVCQLGDFNLSGGLSVCVSVLLMFGMGFVCLCVSAGYVWHGVCLFVRGYKLCLAWGLSVCASVLVMWHGVCLFVRGYKLCLARFVSLCVMFGMGFVCLCVGTGYAWHGVCLFVRGYKLCLAWGLSLCASVLVMFGMGFVCRKHSSLIVFGIFGSPEKDCFLVLKRTVYYSRIHILPSCQATAPSLLRYSFR